MALEDIRYLQINIEDVRNESFGYKSAFGVLRQANITLTHVIVKRRALERQAFIRMVALYESTGNAQETVRLFRETFEWLVQKGFGTWPSRELPDTSFTLQQYGIYDNR